MNVYIARENAIDFDFDDIILGVFDSKDKAIKACEVSMEAWVGAFESDEKYTASGWVNYNELLEGGLLFETTMVENPGTTLYHYVYDCEVQ